MEAKVHRVTLEGLEETLTKAFGKPVRVKGIKLQGETHIREGAELKATIN